MGTAAYVAKYKFSDHDDEGFDCGYLLSQERVIEDLLNRATAAFLKGNEGEAKVLRDAARDYEKDYNVNLKNARKLYTGREWE